jgi:hypothetical protein
MGGVSFRLRCVAVCLALCATTFPQDEGSSERLRAITRAAGTIFRGTVISVEHRAPSRPNQLGTVEIVFHVDEGLKGVRTGSTIHVREWIGLWTSRDRYRMGERVALFLYPPSMLGLTSPVGGDAGGYPIDDRGRITLGPSSGRTSPAAARHSGKSSAPPIRFTHQEFRQAVRRALEQ